MTCKLPRAQGMRTRQSSTCFSFSDVGYPFMFQGRPHFAFDTEADATEGELMVNDHRARMNDPVTGRWLTRDPLGYDTQSRVPRERDGSVDPWGAPKQMRTRFHLIDLGGERMSSRAMRHLYLHLESNPGIYHDSHGEESLVQDMLDTIQSAITMGCANLIEYVTAIPLVTGGYGPAYSHCLSHCLITKFCGMGASKAIGIETENRQVQICAVLIAVLGFEDASKTGLCRSARQQTDYWDNELGRSCGILTGQALNPLFGNISCRCCCESWMGGRFHQEGPNTIRPYGPFADEPGPWGDPQQPPPPGWPDIEPWWP